ncbi:MAG: PQQ-like beta-propeller repeat protein [Chloroflexi bacterium]|nr:PQQ-like beta-propeller repeat protein [Chloroflexota bacterium]
MLGSRPGLVAIGLLIIAATACAPRPAPDQSSLGPAAIGRPMYQMDAEHSGRSPYVGPRKPLLLRTFDTSIVPTPDPIFGSSDIQSSAAIGSDGTAYIGLHNGTLFALRDPAGAGNQLAARWSFHPPGGSSWHATPAVGRDGTVYVGFSTNNASTDAQGTLYALRAPISGIDPVVLWSADLGPGRETASPTIGADGTIYAIGGEGRLSAITPDGDVEWTVQTGPTLKASPALGSDGTVYVSSMNGKLYAVAPPMHGGTATVRWTFRFAEYPGKGQPVVSHSPPAGADGIGSGASPTVAPDGTVYVGANNSNFYAISPDGQLDWMFQADREIAGIWTTAALSADNSTLYFGANKGGVYALNRSDGALRWQYPIVGSIYSSPAVDATGTIYTGSTVGHVFALDGADGHLIFDYDAHSPIWTAPAIRPDGSILIADRDGRVMLLGES